MEAMKAKIIAHPHYSNLLKAYMNCQMVGAPPEVVARLAAARHEFEARQPSSVTSRDPELDQFMLITSGFNGMASTCSVSVVIFFLLY
ncbi:hypothetical protein V6N13_075906 [Hibiscus sabdariffa]